VIEIASRKRNQPAPPPVLFEALCQPNRDPARPWLHLLDDEVWPGLLRTEFPYLVVWSSLWRSRPEATIRFDLPADGRDGTDLRWTLSADLPVPYRSMIAHFRNRIGVLINANLRAAFDQ
jgi:hypothetical protein